MHTMNIEQEDNLYYAVHIDENGASQKLSVGMETDVEVLEFIEKLYEVFDQ